ncbi:histidinol dehydrogenase [Acutalibacter caecimuris]|uniref:histidinol dehydrogenase n=1 Tax=Acutalibacter caecimuris TaxID=3093657 RepID=UPI002AC9168A|nr:histidinol dehydrogenase [Acutalibacter sp. M00118]
MIKTVTATGPERQAFIRELKARAGSVDPKIEQAVAEIVEAVRDGGDEAVKAYSRRFDGWTPDSLELSRQEMERLQAGCDPAFLAALERAARNIYDFHNRQKQQSRIDPMGNGIITGQRVRGLHRAGVYVPGGTAGYPSSVLMNVIPAKVAGVGEIVMATPPGRSGRPDPNIIAAALAAGVDRVFLMGGAQAVAALAFGTGSVPKVDKIVGPGNIYVATAKKQLYGVVDIDMIAGPSEILIIADDSADPEFLAADLMSQAEHDPMASAVLITPSERLAQEAVAAIYRQLPGLSRREVIEQSLDGYGAVIVCGDMDEAVEFANELAPEHLEVCCREPFDYLGRLDNAGSVFLGNYSPEPLGDYYAGANHVLPTGGTARFFSPLSVDDFIKKSSFIYYPREELLKAAGDIVLLAETEELTAHANSIKVRQGR